MLDLLFLTGLAVGLAAAAFIDARAQRIPDALNALLALLGLCFAVIEQRALDALLGLILGYGMIWGVNALYRARRGRDGVGMGDAKLLAAGGAWVGWFGVPFVVLMASSAALAFLAIKSLQGKAIAPTARIAFGPFIAVAVFTVCLVLRFLV